MKVFGLGIPNHRGLTNLDLSEYAKRLGIEHFQGVFMRDTLPKIQLHNECGIVNLNTSDEPGSHWVAYLKMERDVYISIHLDKSHQWNCKDISKQKKKEEKELFNGIQTLYNIQIHMYLVTCV